MYPVHEKNSFLIHLSVLICYGIVIRNIGICLLLQPWMNFSPHILPGRKTLKNFMKNIFVTTMSGFL